MSQLSNMIPVWLQQADSGSSSSSEDAAPTSWDEEDDWDVVAVLATFRSGMSSQNTLTRWYCVEWASQGHDDLTQVRRIPLGILQIGTEIAFQGEVICFVNDGKHFLTFDALLNRPPSCSCMIPNRNMKHGASKTQVGQSTCLLRM